jgi:aquaporin Z
MWQYGFAELLYTFMLCFTVLNVACSKDAPNQYFGIAIGFCVVAGGYGAGAISGGCFNPAIALGIDLPTAGLGWSPIYILFELLGGAAAAGLFKVVRAHEKEEGGTPALAAKLISEFFGTFFLVLTVGLNVNAGSKAAVLSIASSLMIWIFALGNVSGANFNPAVSLCLLITGRRKVLTAPDAGSYMGVQLLGGIAAGFTYCALCGKGFDLAPKGGHNLGQAAFAEILFTFVLCYVVCCTATVANSPLTQYFGLAIGFCVTAGGIASGNVSGGSLNPAVSFGIATSGKAMYNKGDVLNAVYYTLFEFVGAAIAGGLFLFTHANDPSVATKARETREPLLA